MQNPLSFGVGYSPLQSLFYDSVIAAGTLAVTRELLTTVARDVPRGARVLDVGCGGGQALIAVAAQRPDLHLVGVDPSASLVRRAARRAHALPDVEFLQAGAEALPHRAGAFAVVISLFAVKHWRDQVAGLRECARVVRGDGVLVLAEIDASADAARWRRFVELTRMPSFLVPAYVHATTRPILRRGMHPDEMGRLCTQAGIDAITVDRDPEHAVVVGIGRPVDHHWT